MSAQFHVLHRLVGSEAETNYEPIGEVIRSRPPPCPVCGLSGGMNALRPRAVVLRCYGARLGDIAYDVGNDLLFSAPFLDAWRAAGLKGLDVVNPVKIARVRPTRLGVDRPPYFHSYVGRTNVRLDMSQTVVIGPLPDGILGPLCMQCGYRGPIYGIHSLRIDEATWDGEDIFKPWGDVAIIVTDRVLRLAREHDLANVTTTPLAAYRWPRELSVAPGGGVSG